MKNIKLTILGVATLLFALTLNFRHAINDYGVSKNKLQVEVLAQKSLGDRSIGPTMSTFDSKTGPSQRTYVHCIVRTQTTLTKYSDGTTSNGWNVQGGVSGGWSVVGASLSGMYNAGSTSGTGVTSQSITISYADFWAYKYYCPNQTTIGCQEYTPC